MENWEKFQLKYCLKSAKKEKRNFETCVSKTFFEVVLYINWELTVYCSQQVEANL